MTGRTLRERRAHYQFTAIDDCTRIRVLEIFDRLSQDHAIRFLDHVLEKLPFKVEVIQTDNGAEFGSRFHYHVLDWGIGHVYIKPATRRLNARCHYTVPDGPGTERSPSPSAQDRPFDLVSTIDRW
jgi:hypothetical protein